MIELAKYTRATAGACVALLSIVATLTSKEVRHAIRDGAEWLYPLGVIAVLAILLLAAVVAIHILAGRVKRGRSQASAAGYLSKDADTFKALVAVFPRGDVAYWSEVEFGSTWHGSRTHRLMELVNDHDAVEHRFLDQNLEKIRQELMAAANDLLHKCAFWGFQHRVLKDQYELGDAEWVRNNPPEGERYERFEIRRRELSEAADHLVQAYDKLVTEARNRLPGT
jgi:nitrogen fixation/metabolism regulation signal transduction histidine kinase